jgi:hypothetical protein
MDTGERLPRPVHLDSIDKRLLVEHLDQDDEVHGPTLLTPRKATEVVHLLSVSARVARPLNARLKR